MIGPRTALAMALALAVASAAQAKPRCPEKVDLRTCIGVAATATVRFCFLPEIGCGGTGVVKTVGGPTAPFTVEGVRVQGALGTRAVGGTDFPLVLLPGQMLLVDVAAEPTGAGDDRDTLELVLANRLDPAGDENGKVEGDVCEVDLRVRTPSCLPASNAASQCAAEACVDGECRAAPPSAGCDDGDACTTGDACSDAGCAGTPVDCDDGIACTRDTCAGGACRHETADALCDGGECSVAACRPDDAGADGRGCVQAVVGEGEACTDDGVACTDDVCTSGSCLHVPVDVRCPGAATCGGAACAPAEASADATGCVAGPTGGEGGVCAEDGDPCSDDRCRGGACLHDLLAQHTTCAPVEVAFRRALALLALTRSLTVSTEAVGRSQLAVGRGARLTAPLVRLDQELDSAVATLSGRVAVQAGVSAPTGVPETPAQARARAALLLVGRMPLEAQSFLGAVMAARKQGLQRDTSRSLTEQGRALRRGVKRLKVELKRLRRTTVQFAR